MAGDRGEARRAAAAAYRLGDFVSSLLGTQMFDGVSDERFYFVHSYAVQKWDFEVGNPKIKAPMVTWAHHGTDFIAAIENGPLWSTQFHLEKSGLPDCSCCAAPGGNRRPTAAPDHPAHGPGRIVDRWQLLTVETRLSTLGIHRFGPMRGAGARRSLGRRPIGHQPRILCPPWRRADEPADQT